MAILLEAGHISVGCNKVVAVVAGMEWFGQDDIGVYVVDKHDEVVAAAGVDEETTHAVGVKFADVIYTEVELFRLCGRQMAGCCIGGAALQWYFSVLRAWWSERPASFFYVALQSFDGNRAILVHVGVGEAWTGSAVSCFDGCKPG